MEIEELLSRAWTAVEAAGIPENLHEVAFKEALTRIGGPTPIPRVASGPSASEETASDSDEAGKKDGSPRSDDQLFTKFAAESGVAKESLERVFYFDDGTPHLNGPKARLGLKVADQARAIALSLTAAYDYALDVRTVTAEVVRAECVRLKCDPESNWATTMKSLTTVNYVGPSRKKLMRTNSETAAAVQKLVASIVGVPTE